MLKDLEESFTTHVFIDFFFDHTHGGNIIEEHKVPMTKLLESYGLFDGCDKIVRELWQHIIGRIVFEDYSPLVVEFNTSSFIRSIKCIFEEKPGGGDAAYDPLNSVIKNGKFDPLIIRLSISPDVHNYIQSLLCHELTHAYEDFNRRKSQKGLVGQFLKTRYDLTLNAMNNNPNESVRAIATLLHLFTSFERNAYVAQIKADLLYCHRKFEDIAEVVDFLRNTNTYRKYQEMLSLADSVINTTNPQIQNAVLSVIQNISTLRFPNYNTLCKWIRNTAWKIDRKFKTVIPKMANEYLMLKRNAR